MKLCLLVFIATIDGDYKAMSVLRHQGACIPTYLLPDNNINDYKAGFIDVHTYILMIVYNNFFFFFLDLNI